ncbi:N-formylglutamate deformylase [Aurantimonas aggregata]|uniref:N-formylglutamate deformylase n=1 Tax=Aurantimonas aggregata TaxID=2047720 RepID=A0A6L9MCN2_9HYPH|nr:N-formylglutamate deformylase [Aurantimonas aggregata]NDV85242.1 N-formylglutamate deformylase [Aurantimonas aggregata]
MSPVEVHRGSSPVVLGLPHTGTVVPDDIRACLNDEGMKLRDTDWHIDLLYEGLLPGATTVRATFHRYVVDANRDPGGASLYPGQATTSLVPLTDFDNQPIWRDGRAPDDAEVARRVKLFHAPYHAALAAEIARVKAIHGVAILYDCHSIRSRVPYLFEGILPDFNIGTDGGRTCDRLVELAVRGVCETADGYTSIVNGRFRGGWTTRHYAAPGEGVHTIQMELAQATHLASEAPPFAYDETRAARLRPVLAELLRRLEALAPALKG